MTKHSAKPTLHLNSRIAAVISKGHQSISEQLPNAVKMSLVSGEKSNFQFILRILNTNVDGSVSIASAMIG